MTIKRELLKEVTEDANVKHNKKEKSDNGAKVMIYGVPPEWIEVIHKNSMSVSKFAKNAMEDKLKAMGLI